MIRQPNILPVSLDGQELYQLWEDFPYNLRGRQEVARAGFVMDGASVPRIGLWFLNRDGLHRAEALKHDWGYDGKGKMENGLVLSKDAIDTEWLVGLLSLGNLSDRKCEACYQAVHLFGGPAWRSGTGERLILPVGSLAPSLTKRKKRRRNIYDEPICQPFK